jgi:transposase-like protein/DDE family transposase
MRRLATEEAKWAENEMRAADLGDDRRLARATRMLGRAAELPAGKLTEVMRDKAELQGAYDMLEGGRVSARALCASFANATLDRATGERWIFAVVDGSSVQLTDLTGKKGLGSLGALEHGARGMKVISALGVDRHGVTIGLLGQVWWARTNARQDSRDKRKRNSKRPLSDKETRHWIDAFMQAREAADARGMRLWFQVDREGDNQDLLLALDATGHDFTVRAAWDRVTEATGEDEQLLRQRLGREAAVGTYAVELPSALRRSERTANMVVRVARVTLSMHRRGTKRSDVKRLEVNAVWAREEETTPAGEKPLDWLLLTSRPVDSFGGVREVIDGYTQRWRIEDFHRAWKSSVCKVEQMQLRSAEAVAVWATMLANVAVRAERLRLLVRKQPDEPATVELAEHEVRALILLKRQRRSRNEVISDAVPTIAQATLWVAQLGGYTGKSSGGPPGAITIRRGLDVLGPAAEMLAIIETNAK